MEKQSGCNMELNNDRADIAEDVIADPVARHYFLMPIAGNSKFIL